LLLLLPRFALLLGLLEPEFAVIHDAADRWLGVRGDFHQIQFDFLAIRLACTRGRPLPARRPDRSGVLRARDLVVEPEFIIRGDVVALQ